MSMNKKNVSDSDTLNVAAEETNSAEIKETATTEAAPAPSAKERYVGITSFAYIGPTLPGGRLKSLTTLNGTFEQITEYYSETIELFPQVSRLIIPVANLAESRGKIEKGGNLLSNHYQELTAAIRARGDE